MTQTTIPPGGLTMRTGHLERAHPRRDGGAEYRLLVAATFLLVLPVAALRRLVPRGGGPRGSILAEAREEAQTVIAIAFMA
jgi:hypothetical protein